LVWVAGKFIYMSKPREREWEKEKVSLSAT
jgi:hypothetical protein